MLIRSSKQNLICKGRFSNSWNFISKFMVWLKNNMVFSPKRLEKDYLLMKIGWNFKFETSGHPESDRARFSRKIQNWGFLDLFFLIFPLLQGDLFWRAKKLDGP